MGVHCTDAPALADRGSPTLDFTSSSLINDNNVTVEIVKVVDLEVTSTALLHTDGSKMCFTDSTIWIVNNAGIEVLVYHQSGSFIHKLADHGRGPGEFEKIHTISIDKESGQLLLYDGIQRKIMFYSLEQGTFEGEILLNDNCTGAYAVPKSNDLVLQSPFGSSEYMYTYVKDRDMSVLEPFAKKNWRDIRFTGHPLTTHKDILFAMDPFNSTIFRVSSKMIESQVVLLDNPHPSPDEVSGDPVIEWGISDGTRKYDLLNSYRETDNHRFAFISSRELGGWDMRVQCKKSGKVYSKSSISSNTPFAKHLPLIPGHSTSSNISVCMLTEDLIRRLMNIDVQDINHPDLQEWRIDENPRLVFYEVSSF